MKQEVDRLLEQLGLQEHPEGGYFRETYRSKDTLPHSALPGGYDGDRDLATGIYFLLTSDNFSAFHKIRQDEMWHFYQGDPITIHMIAPDGTYNAQTLGTDLHAGQLPQFTVPGGYWFASEVPAPGNYALTGCTVFPGFDFSDFTLAERDALIHKYPDHQKLITRLTRI